MSKHFSNLESSIKIDLENSHIYDHCKVLTFAMT